jgi:hypothetical protein
MRVLPNARTSERAVARDAPAGGLAKPASRFLLHLAEMCVVMCGSGFLLSLLFFQTADFLGYDNLPETAPGLSVFVIAINLSVPMAAWMRFRRMEWRPTVEMAGATMATGLLLIASYWLGLVPQESLISIQTSLACPVMLAVMLLRFRLYSAPHMAHRGHA